MCHEQNVVDCFDFSAPQAFLNDAQAHLTLTAFTCRSVGRVVGLFQGSWISTQSVCHQVQKALGVPVGLAWRPCNLQVDSAHLV